MKSTNSDKASKCSIPCNEDIIDKAFAKIKETLANAPVMMAPIAGKVLKLYLAFNDNAIGIVLAQDDQNGQEKANILC